MSHFEQQPSFEDFQTPSGGESDSFGDTREQTYSDLSLFAQDNTSTDQPGSLPQAEFTTGQNGEEFIEFGNNSTNTTSTDSDAHNHTEGETGSEEERHTTGVSQEARRMGIGQGDTDLVQHIAGTGNHSSLRDVTRQFKAQRLEGGMIDLSDRRSPEEVLNDKAAKVN